MAVQEFMLDEVREVAESDEKGEQWSKMVEDLGLEGQRQLCSAKPTSPIPFPFMNKEMIKVYETLCPSKALIKDYNKTAIPIRVLEIAGFCVMKEYFGKIEVWFDDRQPDPILVGCDGEDKYILARWAAEIEEYAILRKKAIDRKIKDVKIRYEEHLRDVQATMASLESAAEDWLKSDYSWYTRDGVEWAR